MWLLQQLSRRPSPHVILQHVVFLCRGAVARCLRCSQETLGLELGGGQGQAGQEGGEVGPGDVLSAQPRDVLFRTSREVWELLCVSGGIFYVLGGIFYVCQACY